MNEDRKRGKNQRGSEKKCLSRMDKKTEANRGPWTVLKQKQKQC